MSDYQATPVQWSRLQQRYLGGNDLVCAVLELRDEIEALKVNLKSTSNSSQIRSTLVERVAATLHRVTNSDPNVPVNEWKPEARAVIREVADWMREHRSYPHSWLAQMLEHEADR
jgi:sensor domain CHASE-containing protein